MTDFVYDLECYYNVFTVYIGNCDTRKCYGFEISDRKDQREEMFEHLRDVKRCGGRMVGFNNLFYDYPLLHFLLKNQSAPIERIFEKSQEILKSDKFESSVKPQDVLIPQIDLYKIHHFDNHARATSLKALEFNMRSDNIEDLPYEPGSILTSKQIDNLLVYNKHDMYQTYLFYVESLDQIKFREELTKKYNRDFLNHNDTKIGKDYFIMKLEEAAPNSCYQNGRVRQTKRDKIKLENCILPYIEFQRPEFQAVLDWLKEQVISETKGVFTDIMEYELGDLAQYASMRTKKKKLPEEPSEEEVERLKQEIPKSWVEPYHLKSGKTSWYWMWRVADNLNTTVDGFQFDFGTGGLHMSIENQIVDESDEQIIVDKDVTSYYPNLAIVNGVYPAHLGKKFCEIYEDVYKQRQQYPKGTAENAMMKLALNGVYGDSNNQYSPFYDPQYTMTITISGQLSLCMLAERLLEVPSLALVQINTDGLTYTVHPSEKEKAEKVCEQWQRTTGLTLETNQYKRMAVADVNSYLALDKGRKVKQKGRYQYKDMGWHQDQSALVVRMAAEYSLLYDGEVEDFILNHDDKMDFMIRVKVPRDSRLVGVKEDMTEIPLQNITRYYVANDGLSLVKIMPPLPKEPEKERRIGVQKEWKVRPCNDIADFKGDINYNYYIEEARKIVDPLLTS